MYCALDGQESNAVVVVGHHEKVEVDEEERHLMEVNRVLGRVDENEEMCWSPSGPWTSVLQNIL